MLLAPCSLLPAPCSLSPPPYPCHTIRCGFPKNEHKAGASGTSIGAGKKSRDSMFVHKKEVPLWMTNALLSTSASLSPSLSVCPLSQLPSIAVWQAAKAETKGDAACDNYRIDMAVRDAYRNTPSGCGNAASGPPL